MQPPAAAIEFRSKDIIAMPLLPAVPYGAVNVFGALPEIEEYGNVIFAPNSPEMGHAWGMYDAAGWLIPAGAYRTGPQRDCSIQEPRLKIDPADV